MNNKIMQNLFFTTLLLLSPYLSTAQTATGQAESLYSSNIGQMQKFKLDDGNMAYEDSQTTGPVIVCIPGIGDTRAQFRLLAPMLVKLGYHVITVDPRGQGDSDATFDEYSASSAGEDIIKLIDSLHTEVYLIGNSAGGAAAAWIAAERPEKIKGIIFIAAFLRDHPISIFNKIILQLGLRGPWAPYFWTKYYKTLFISNPPPDQSKYITSLEKNLDQPERMSALRSMIFSSKSDVELKLSSIHVPVLAVGGSRDPDFEIPEAELDWILTKMRGEKLLIENAGHYPHLEYPEKLVHQIQRFIMARTM